MTELGKILNEEYDVIKSRKENIQEGSYTCYLFKKGLDKILKKIGEEASETIIAAKNGDKKETVGEICDLLFHTEVMMAELGLDWNDITRKHECGKGSQEEGGKQDRRVQYKLK